MSSLQGIDEGALHSWFARHMPAAGGPLKFTLIAGGQSNLTYKVVDQAGAAFVLRRPPLGPLPAGAHDVEREHRILAAVGQTSVPVPEVLGLCVDREVIGAPFYVMRWVDGMIVDRRAVVDKFLPDNASRNQAASSLVDRFADLHLLDVDRIGLGDLSRRESYVARNLKRMRQVWENTKTRELPIIESLHARLLERQPPQRHSSLIHMDYRLGNLILKRSGEVAAVLDWELCTIGDAIADFAFLLCNWDQPDDSWSDVWTEIAPTRAGGFPSRELIVARYAARTGFDVSNLDYYRAFTYWRIAIIAEGIKRRCVAGAMAGQHFDIDTLEKRVRDRAHLADRFMTAAET